MMLLGLLYQIFSRLYWLGTTGAGWSGLKLQEGDLSSSQS